MSEYGVWVTKEEAAALLLAVARSLTAKYGDGVFSRTELEAEAEKAIHWAEGMRIGAGLLELVLRGELTISFSGVEPPEPQAQFRKADPSIVPVMRSDG